MEKSQNGFGAVGPIVVLAIVTLVGFVGWYIWHSTDTTNKSQDTALDSSASSTSAKSETSSSRLRGYKEYEDANFSLQYPEKWEASTKTDRPEWVFFTSPDFEPPPGKGPRASAESGYLLEVRIAKSEPGQSFSGSLKLAKKALGVIGGTYKVIKIDGKNAILSDQKTEGTYIYATTFNAGNMYYFRLKAVDEDKPMVKNLFNTILSTIQIK